MSVEFPSPLAQVTDGRFGNSRFPCTCALGADRTICLACAITHLAYHPVRVLYLTGSLAYRAIHLVSPHALCVSCRERYAWLHYTDKRVRRQTEIESLSACSQSASSSCQTRNARWDARLNTIPGTTSATACHQRMTACRRTKAVKYPISTMMTKGWMNGRNDQSWPKSRSSKTTSANSATSPKVPTQNV